jgi:hypothetical protein
MFRFAWAYQGSGAATYLAGGATIDLKDGSAAIDLAAAEAIDALPGTTIDLTRSGAELEVTNDGNGIDLQG